MCATFYFFVSCVPHFLCLFSVTYVPHVSVNPSCIALN
jgi:hypothetical protein